MELLAALLAGLVVGVLLAWLVLRQRAQSAQLAQLQARAQADVARTRVEEQAGSWQRQCEDLQVRVQVAAAQAQQLQQALGDERQASGRLGADVTARTRRMTELEQAVADALATHSASAAELAQTQAQLARVQSELDSERRQSREKLALLEQARTELSNQFKALASEILDEKSRKFTEQNQVQLGHLLNPLNERIKSFQSKVEEVYVVEGKERSALAEQVRQLMTLNQALSADANNLTLALKGDHKAQGNWGEIILDDVLERAGLLRDQQYTRQGSVTTADGKTRSIPDVVIRLPQGRNLVVDSKLTLPDYRAFSVADNEAERSAALKRHIAAIRAHIKGLSEKSYQSLYELESFDFVVMFIPLEPAFMLAVTHDADLFQHAWERNVLLVSPSTLLFVVRTVVHLWQQEHQGRNARDISRRGAELYDKLCGFVADLNKVGTSLQAAQESFADARRKLSEGRGNVIRQAEMLRELGVKPGKALPASWVESSTEAAALPGPAADPADL